MSNERTGLYEGMFLFPQSATSNLQDAVDHLKSILDKCNVTIITLKKWDDRRLAYEIAGNKRGVYFLVFFNAPTSSISEIERRCNQSEQILRMMVTKAEHLPKEIIEANDGTEALASEIKLRGEKKVEGSSATASTISRKEDKEPEVAAPAKAKTEKTPAKAQTEKTPAKAQTEKTPAAEKTKETITKEVTEA